MSYPLPAISCDRTRRPAPPIILRLADGVYLPPGGRRPLRLEFSENMVLSSFLGRPALTLRELVNRSGVTHASRILARLAAKYDGAFAAAICRPKRRGRGGYFVAVRDAAPTAVHKQAGNAP